MKKKLCVDLTDAKIVNYKFYISEKKKEKKGNKLSGYLENLNLKLYWIAAR